MDKMKSLLRLLNSIPGEYDHFAALGGMRPGDSYFVPELPVQSEVLAKRLKALAAEMGIPVKVSATHQDLVYGVRVWRLH